MAMQLKTGIMASVGPSPEGKWRFVYYVNGRALISIEAFDDQASARQAGRVAEEADVKDWLVS